MGGNGGRERSAGTGPREREGGRGAHTGIIFCYRYYLYFHTHTLGPSSEGGIKKHEGEGEKKKKKKGETIKTTQEEHSLYPTLQRGDRS